MIPPVVMYVLGAVLVLFGIYRLNLGRRRQAKGRMMHVVFGALYVAMGLFLILTTARVIPAPRFGAPPHKVVREVSGPIFALPPATQAARSRVAPPATQPAGTKAAPPAPGAKGSK